MLKERLVDEVEELTTSRRRKSLKDKRRKAPRQQREEALQHDRNRKLAVYGIGLDGHSIPLHLRPFFFLGGGGGRGGGGGHVAVALRE